MISHHLQDSTHIATNVITAGVTHGPVTWEVSGFHARIVERITGLIEDEVRAGRYDPPVEPSTLGYAIVRLAEAFLFNDAVAGMRGDVERLREVEGALLGV